MSNKPHNRFTAPPRKVEESEDATSLNHQEGGDHYKKHKIQPIEYIVANSIGFVEGSVIKYVTRWQDKGGVEDLKKARHLIDMLIELRGGADVGDNLASTENVGPLDESPTSTSHDIQGITYHRDGRVDSWGVYNILELTVKLASIIKYGAFRKIQVTGPSRFLPDVPELLGPHLDDPARLSEVDIKVVPVSDSFTSTLIITNNRREPNAPSS